jgi:hypothetical protein
VRLAQAHEWRGQHHADLNDLEREFLDASDARQVREAEAEQARQRRELAQAQALAAAQQQRAEEQARATMHLRWRTVWLAVVALVAVGAAGWAWRQQQAATRNALLARTNEQRADTRAAEATRLRHLSIAQALAAQALRQHDQHRDERSALLARQAFLFNARHQGHVLDQVDDALRTVLSAPYFSHILRHKGIVTSVAFSPDGQRLATGSVDGTVQVWIARTATLADMVCEKIWRNLMPDEWRQFVGADLAYEQTCPNRLTHKGAPLAESTTRSPE